MFELPEALPAAALQPGSNVLVAGPPMTRKRSLAYDVMTRGFSTGDALLFVTTSAGNARELSSLRAELAPERMSVVEVGTARDADSNGNEDVFQVPSASDLTGVSINLDRLLQRSRADDATPLLAVDSLTTLLQYVDDSTVFKFAHSFTNRIAYRRGLSVFVLDTTPEMPTPQPHLEQLFDTKIELRRRDGDREARVLGPIDIDESWQRV